MARVLGKVHRGEMEQVWVMEVLEGMVQVQGRIQNKRDEGSQGQSSKLRTWWRNCFSFGVF